MQFTNASSNFMRNGCYFADESSEWLIDVSQIHIEDFPDNIPEISVDPNSRLLSLINSHSSLYKSFTLSLSGKALPILSKDNDNKEKSRKTLAPSSSRIYVTGKPRKPEHLITAQAVTIVALVPPSNVFDVCFLSSLPNTREIVSDVRLLSEQLLTLDCVDNVLVVMFPLICPSLTKYECVQGFYGKFTHVFPENSFAADFSCPIGTPVVACLPGYISEVCDQYDSEGIHVNNFYSCNYVAVKHGEEYGGVVSEYVHILKGSCTLLGLKVGDKVNPGQTICRSGNSGFSPQPHLHFQVNLGQNSVPFVFGDILRSGNPRDRSFPTIGSFYPQ